MRNQLSSRKDYYSNSVIRDRKDGVNSLVTEQDYSRQEASAHAENFGISKLKDNYKIRLLWEKMKGNIAKKKRKKELKPYSVLENPEEGSWQGSSDWVSTWISSSY